ncbi:hypothetical protein NP493_1232g00014 [Ridgeia piscesae]|uniref:Persulfide dioxygenase ETHE1, mitochondrial n=1 Tax=Ridgeia piscesae TaxID=27915 RepID=A0AAD9KC21_RIDPI|nr:hypothetical protein NP493_1232g00014 [Ridgeia piscesae]
MTYLCQRLLGVVARTLKETRVRRPCLSTVTPVWIRPICSCACVDDLLFRQLFDNFTYTYTYLLADNKSKEAVIIDPVIDLVQRDLRIIRDFNLELRYALNTHVHADHVTGSGVLKQRIPTCQSVISAASEAKANVHVGDGDILRFGAFSLEVRATPGHTTGCLTFVLHGCRLAFTGDALLIRGCGRTDFPQGNAETLYRSVHEKIFSLPENFMLYPGHDYTGQTVTTVGEEKAMNRRLKEDLSGFTEIMNNLKLPMPKEFAKTLPVNMECGVFDE